MQFDPTIKAKAKTPSLPVTRGVIIGVGIVFIVLSLVTAGFSLWEAFATGGKMNLVELPGFHELELKNAGLYAGMYQHRGTGPLPAKELSKLDVRLMSKKNYEEIPVLMNNTGQTFNQFGVQGMPIFNFVVQEPGAYTLSAVYPGNEKGPTVPVMIFSQAMQNIKQTLIVGGSFFLLFLVLGIFVLVRVNHWFPPEAAPTKK